MEYESFHCFDCARACLFVDRRLGRENCPRCHSARVFWGTREEFLMKCARRGKNNNSQLSLMLMRVLETGRN